MSSSLVRQFETDSLIAARSSQTVPLIHASPLAWTRARTSLVVPSSGKRKSTWLSTTSFSTSHPETVSISAANCRARAHERSIRLATPARPRERRAAYTAKPRARRENSGVQSTSSRAASGSCTR